MRTFTKNSVTVGGGNYDKYKTVWNGSFDRVGYVHGSYNCHVLTTNHISQGGFGNGYGN